MTPEDLISTNPLDDLDTVLKRGCWGHVYTEKEEEGAVPLTKNEIRLGISDEESSRKVGQGDAGFSMARMLRF